MNKVIITVALNGSLPTKEMNPHVPMTPEEIGVTAAKCQESGASIAHVHARDSNGRPTLDPEVFERIHAEISARTDLIVQISTGARAGTDTEERAEPVRRIRPEMASLTTGSMNFPKQVYSNSFEVFERLAAVMKDAGTKPEMEIFEAGMIHWTPAFVAALAYVAVFLSVISMILLTIMIRRGAVLRMTSMFFLVPPMAILLSYLILDEPVGWMALTGMAVAVVGVALVVAPERTA